MTITADPWASSSPHAEGRHLVQVPLRVLNALSEGDLEAAQRLSPFTLTTDLVSEGSRRVWMMRREQIARDERDADWVTRFVLDTGTGTVVGRAGFHGPPDANGMVELGYGIDPAHRRRGHARAALVIMLEMGMSDPRVNVIRATVSPDNLPSRQLIDQYGFHEEGEQWDDEDGLETILELDAR